jgi:hypothetical protein
MWCGRCQQDVPFLPGNSAEAMICTVCGSDKVFSATAKPQRKHYSNLSTESAMNSPDSTLAGELQRVQRLVRNVDLLLGDSLGISTRRAAARKESATTQGSSARDTTTAFGSRISNGSATRSSSPQLLEDEEPFVDPTKTLTFPEICGMLTGFFTMVGALILSAMMMLGRAEPHWAIGLGLVVCVTTGILLIFWQRIEAQQRDLMLLRRYLRRENPHLPEQVLQMYTAPRAAAKEKANA